MRSLNELIEKINEIFTVDEYHENGILSGYEWNTYTSGGVNQIIFVDFRDTDIDTSDPNEVLTAFIERVESIDISEEIEVNRENPRYKEHFSLGESLDDFEQWKTSLLKRLQLISKEPPKFEKVKYLDVFQKLILDPALQDLQHHIMKSNKESRFMNTTCINLEEHEDMFSEYYAEIVLYSEKITLLGETGLHYSINDLDTEELLQFIDHLNHK